MLKKFRVGVSFNSSQKLQVTNATLPFRLCFLSIRIKRMLEFSLYQSLCNFALSFCLFLFFCILFCFIILVSFVLSSSNSISLLLSLSHFHIAKMQLAKLDSERRIWFHVFAFWRFRPNFKATTILILNFHFTFFDSKISLLPIPLINRLIFASNHAGYCR